ncbi:DUF2398 family protein [Companilactobacillus ginsenosidimutans]|uniref:TIGR02678 family protein n=1 Tax=Companilactobacillus ginsenosidimutans TaxID=1007676 RepID=A0A0H4QG87_9LACO|nr:DUF2398 family protein [Companilactobacillus ginsenosidimutans]AKP67414.1 hypothetical protein ABM34_07610 [Companilactobacillus ginsenosidimutans]
MKNDEDIRICLDALLENRVILDNKQSELFRLIKKNTSDLRKLCLNDLGMRLIVNAHFIKLEKIPEYPQSFMGIENFDEVEDYVMFACVMSFLEETGPDTPFLLPDLTDNLKRNMPVKIDWTEFQIRKRLVRVIKQLVELSVINVLDGNYDEFDRNENEEALFTATNYSRYLLRRFPENLQNLESWEQLKFSPDEHATRIKVIQSLFISPGICRTEETEELFRYMRNQQKFLIDYFERYSYYDFELSKDLGLLVSHNRRAQIKYIPDNSSAGDLLMIVGDKLRDGQFNTDEYGQIHLGISQWQSIVSEAVIDNQELLSKTYREKSLELLAKELLAQTNQTGLTKLNDTGIVVTPIFARLSGEFIKND